MPWVRSGSCDKGICLSGESAVGSDCFAACASGRFGDGGAFADSEGVDRGVEEGFVCCWGLEDLEAAPPEGAPNLEEGLLSLAIPLVHIEGAAVKAAGALRVGMEVAHLDTAAGWARRRAALESMVIRPILIITRENRKRIKMAETKQGGSLVRAERIGWGSRP